MDIKDFFHTYGEFVEFVSPKMYSVQKEESSLKRRIRKDLRSCGEKYSGITYKFLLRWYELTDPVYRRYSEVLREIKSLKRYIMLARVQYQGRSIEEFKPLAIETAKAVKVAGLLNEITRRMSRDTYLCPIHEETSGSLKVYKNNSWYCFGCCQGGTAIDLIMKYYDMPLSDAVGFLIGG